MKLLVINDLALMQCHAAEALAEMRCRVADAGLDLAEGDLVVLKAGSIINMMVLPGGTHNITPEVNGRAQAVSVLVDAQSAVELNKQLAILNAHRGNKRAFFDFDHESKVASGWPLEFSWQEAPAPGVYARVELSAAGADAIKGKNYRAFSIAAPIKRGNPARITASEAFGELALGGLVNDPAFPTILPLWAKNAGASSATENQPNKNTMTPEQIAALQAKNTELSNEITTLKAKQSRTELETEQLKAKQAELDANAAKLEVAALKARNAEQDATIKAQRKKDAEAAVTAAVQRGAIPAQNDTLKAKWQKTCEENPESIEMLNAMSGNPALAGGRIIQPGQVEVVDEAIVTVVKSYCAERDPLKRGILFASKLSKVMADPLGLDAVLKAADTYSTTLVVQQTLQLLKWQYPMLSSITTDFTSERANYGDAITTRTVGAPTVQTYNTTTGWPTAANGTTADVAVTMNAHKGVPIFFDSNVLGSTRRNLYQEQVEAAYNAIAKDISDALLAVVTTANFTNTPVTEAAVDFDRTTLIDLGQALTEAKNPQTGRTLLLNPAYYAALMKDTTVVGNLVNPNSGGAIASGRLPNVHGFNIIEQGNLPTTGNLTGFGYTKSALVLATRLPADYTNVLPGAGNGTSQIVTNPEDGFSVMLVQYVDNTLAKAVWRIAVMYGVAKGQAAAGTIVRSSA